MVKMYNRIFITLMLICLLFSSINLIPNVDTNKELETKTLEKLENIVIPPSDVIRITNDANFTDYGFPGSGTEQDPFRIEHLAINNITSGIEGIYINGTTKHFIIQNCTVIADYYSILIQYINPGTAIIHNNTLLNSSYGLGIKYTNDQLVTNNTFIDPANNLGLYTFLAEDIMVANNSFFDAYMYFSSSNNITIVHNSVTESSYGIRFIGSPNGIIISDNYFTAITRAIYANALSNSNIESNIIQNATDYGMYIRSPNNLTIRDNVFYNCSVQTEGSMQQLLSLQMSNNTINGKELLFMKNKIDTIINQDNIAQIILVNVSNTHIEDINFERVSRAIEIHYSNHTTLRSITATKCSAEAIFIDYAYNLTLNNSKLDFNGHGVVFMYSSDLSFTNNTVTNIQSYAFSSDEEAGSNLSITHNIIENVRYGISLASHDIIEIAHNQISNSTDDAIYLDGSTGIFITDNTLKHCQTNAITLYDTSTCVMTNNIVFNTTSYYFDIQDEDSANNSIYHNFFIGSTEEESKANDNGVNNTFYNPILQEGNYWSDWSGSEAYNISGSANSQDLYPLNDTDGDNLNETLEVLIYQTDPFNNDTDEDGLNDYEEVFIYPTDVFNSDSDEDGLLDGEEIAIGTDPNNADTDNDGMEDWYEYRYGLNPLVNDTDADLDSDGLTNLEEQTLGTAPNDNDTDADGIPDGYEITNTLDPLIDDSQLDPDGDELTNSEEFTLGTDPQVADTDTDGLPDGFEVNNALDPLTDDSQLDSDNDGLTNLEEYNNGTNPNNSDTDEDGYSDSEELEKGTNPTDPSDYPTADDPLLLIVGLIVIVGIIGGLTVFIAWKKGKIFTKQ